MWASNFDPFDVESPANLATDERDLAVRVSPAPTVSLKTMVIVRGLPRMELELYGTVQGSG